MKPLHVSLLLAFTSLDSNQTFGSRCQYGRTDLAYSGEPVLLIIRQEVLQGVGLLSLSCMLLLTTLILLIHGHPRRCCIGRPSVDWRTASSHR